MSTKKNSGLSLKKSLECLMIMRVPFSLLNLQKHTLENLSSCSVMQKICIFQIFIKKERKAIIMYKKCEKVLFVMIKVDILKLNYFYLIRLLNHIF